jgi:hypothetical protein
LGEVIVYYREVTTKKIDQENETKEWITT